MKTNETIFNSGNILAYAGQQLSKELAIPADLAAHLELICRAMEQHNKLNNLGRKILIRQLALNLINNCAIRQSVAENPAIAGERLQAPIFITGLPRTGTSLLHKLMALDESNRTLRLHEAINPVDLPDRLGYREHYARTWSAFMQRAMPDTRHMIEVDIESPIECCFLKRNSLLCHSLGYQAGLGDLEKSLLTPEKLAECYDLFKLQLQLIQHQSRNGRWLLKCPSHFSAVEQIYSRFPDAVIVRTSRDISEVISSFTSLISTIRSNLSVSLSRDAVALELMQSIKLQLEIHRRFSKTDRITAVDYAELARDPVGCVSGIYRSNGIHYPAKFERKMTEWLKKNPHQKNGKHIHAPSMFGLSQKIIHEFFTSAAKRIDDSSLAEPIN
jgi:hypothetical protein